MHLDLTNTYAISKDSLLNVYVGSTVVTHHKLFLFAEETFILTRTDTRSFSSRVRRLRGWSGGAKVSCILSHRGVQLILVYSWARPAILLAGKGRGGECFYFFYFFTFIPIPLFSLSLSFISSTITSISFLHFSGRRHKMTHMG